MDGGRGPVVNKTEARSGETSGHMRIVLVVSILLVVAAFGWLVMSFV
jgi:hypothetical protein